MLSHIGLVPLLVNTAQNIKLLNGLDSTADTSYDVAIVDSITTARRLRSLVGFKYIPIVLLAPVVHVSLKTVLDLGITSCMTTPCLAIDLSNAIIPALENRVIPSPADNSKPLNILLAEDNIVNQGLAVKLLKKYHHVVTVVGNELEALEAIKIKRYDIILMDVQMPVMVCHPV